MILTRTPIRTALFVFFLSCIFSNSQATAQALPVVTIAPTQISATYITGSSIPTAAIGTIAVTSTIPVSVQVASSGIQYVPAGNSNWLEVIPPPGTPGGNTPANFSVYLSPLVVTLPVGTYEALIPLTFGSSLDPSSTQPQVVVVLLTVAPAGSGGGINPNETVTATPASLSFAYAAGGAVPAAQTLTVQTSDSANFSAVAVTNDGNPWLLISPTSGTSPGTINVSVNPAILNAGSYTGNITVSGPSASVQVPVSLTVAGLSITASPSALTFNIPQNYGYGAPQYLQITSGVSTPFTTAAASDSNWLVVDTLSGTTPASVTVRANSGSLLPGSYSGTVTIQVSPSNSIQVPVSLTVGPPAAVSLAPANLSFAYTIGGTVPANQTVNVKSLSGAAQTFSTSAMTNDGAAWLTASPTSPTPGAVSVGISPASLLPGSYSGVVNVTPSASGSSPEPIVVSLTVLPAPTPTVMSVVSAASFAGGAVAPGEFVVLFGSALGPATLTTPTPGNLPDTLGGTVVTFDGIPAPLLYSSATQTSVQVPYGINSPQTVMTVQRSGVSSNKTTIASQPTFPGLFTSNASGNGQAAALNPDYSLNSASNPATRGSYIVLYGTGEGKTNPVSVEGTITPSIQPLPQPLYPVTVTFGGYPGAVFYAGETPTAVAGLMQINVTIPLSAPTGPAVPVLVTINGQTSPGNVTVAIQ